MKKIDTDLYIIENKSAAVLFDRKEGHTPVKAKKSNSDSNKYVNWGDDNTYPQEFTRKLNKTGAAIGGLDVLVSAHFGLGFRLYQDSETKEGVTARERLRTSFPEINQFFKFCRWDITMAEIVEDFETYGIAFVEYLLSPNFQHITSIKRHQSAHCRLGVPQKKGYVEKVYINTDWEDLDEEITEEVPFFSDIHSVEILKTYCKEKNIRKFIVPVMRTLSTEKNYPKVKWHSSFHNGWMDVVLSVPVFKKYMFENQLNVKFVIYIADDFFIHKFGVEDWRSMEKEEKEKHRENTVKIIDEHMSGNKASGRSLISPFFRDQNGNLIKGIEVVPIDDKIKDGSFLPDATAGNSEILFPMGVDPCLLGAGIPGGSGGGLNGAGSDKREAYTILSTRMPIRRIRTLEIFERIRDWNGWEPTLYGNFPNINLTTLDKNPNGQQTIVN
ncbi:hypothetical protein CAPN004_09150 [Capnocytophaga cynodegmi]|nr:hypothetical protein [Capnocytophaga cynodegmi]GIM51885.1 hypothetical protein CAPN004_09150 [Capnocytophaga cynodegmi]